MQHGILGLNHLLVHRKEAQTDSPQTTRHSSLPLRAVEIDGLARPGPGRRESGRRAVGEKTTWICRAGRRFPWRAVAYPSAGRDHANLPRAVPTDPEAGPGVWSLESRGAANNFFPFVVLLCRLVPCFAVLLLLVCQAVELSLRLAVTIMVFRICDSESERRGGL